MDDQGDWLLGTVTTPAQLHTPGKIKPTVPLPTLFPSRYSTQVAFSTDVEEGMSLSEDEIVKFKLSMDNIYAPSATIVKPCLKKTKRIQKSVIDKPVDTDHSDAPLKGMLRRKTNPVPASSKVKQLKRDLLETHSYDVCSEGKEGDAKDDKETLPTTDVALSDIPTKYKGINTASSAFLSRSDHYQAKQKKSIDCDLEKSTIETTNPSRTSQVTVKRNAGAVCGTARERQDNSDYYWQKVPQPNTRNTPLRKSTPDRDIKGLDKGSTESNMYKREDNENKDNDIAKNANEALTKLPQKAKPDVMPKPAQINSTPNKKFKGLQEANAHDYVKSETFTVLPPRSKPNVMPKPAQMNSVPRRNYTTDQHFRGSWEAKTSDNVRNANETFTKLPQKAKPDVMPKPTQINSTPIRKSTHNEEFKGLHEANACDYVRQETFTVLLQKSKPDVMPEPAQVNSASLRKSTDENLILSGDDFKDLWEANTSVDARNANGTFTNLPKKSKPDVMPKPAQISSVPLRESTHDKDVKALKEADTSGHASDDTFMKLPKKSKPGVMPKPSKIISTAQRKSTPDEDLILSDEDFSGLWEVKTSDNARNANETFTKVPQKSKPEVMPNWAQIDSTPLRQSTPDKDFKALREHATNEMFTELPKKSKPGVMPMLAKVNSTHQRSTSEEDFRVFQEANKEYDLRDDSYTKSCSSKISDNIDETFKGLCQKSKENSPMAEKMESDFGQNQSSRIKGRIVRVINRDENPYGFIKPLGDSIQRMCPKDVYFQVNYVTDGGLGVTVNDKVEFKIQAQCKRSQKAFTIKVVKFARRQIREVEDFLKKLNKTLKDGNSSEKPSRDNVLKALSCSALWECIGESLNDDNYPATSVLINILHRMQSFAPTLEHAFCRILKTLCGTQFFDPWYGVLNKYIKFCSLNRDYERINSIKRFLKMIITKVPEKSAVVLTHMKPLISSHEDSMDHYLFSILTQTVTHSTFNVHDLNWADMPLVPTAVELTNNPFEAKGNLRPVKKEGQYESVDDYMDTYFRLLRADCFSAIIDGVKALLTGQLDPRDMNVYHSIKLIGVHFTRRDNGIALAIEISSASEVEDWTKSSKLMFGNLLCLSVTGNFKDPIWATVFHRNAKLLQKKRLLYIELVNEYNTMTTSAILIELMNGRGDIIAVESPSYYRASQPIMKALQNKNLDDFPFKQQLIDVDNIPCKPEYIEQITSEAAIMKILGTSKSSLDPSQLEALQNVLCNKIGIIQGPPGTGKTYIGTKIVDIILSLPSPSPGPILVLTYKNHALDEFLKALVKKFPNDVARVGGGSSEPILEDCNLKSLARTQRRCSFYTEMYAEEESLRPVVENCARKLINSLSYSYKTLLEFASNTQLVSLLENCPWHATKLTYKNRKFRSDDIKKFLPENTQSVKSLLEDKEYQNKDIMIAILKAAFTTWYPAASTEEKVKKHLGIKASTDMATINGLQTAKVIVEEDAEEMEKERMNAKDSRGFRPEDTVIFPSAKDSPSLFCNTTNVIEQLPVAKLMCCQNLWSLESEDRVKFVQCLLIRQSGNTKDSFEQTMSAYEQVCSTKSELDVMHHTNVLQGKKIVGMTITGASIHNALLCELKPSVVLVEEAAEVLEPQLIAALGKSVQHLILIGDHKQLRPSVQCHELKRNYNFDISMMERLIANGMTFTTLQQQNRMHPEISVLLKDIYPELGDNLAIVGKRQRPACFEYRVFFWHHNSPEEGSRSLINEDEAKRVINLSIFLLEHGYRPQQITILAAYQGQAVLLRSLMNAKKMKKPELFPELINGDEVVQPEIAIHTIDMYQGDENDVVIVSLVRSNDEGDIGYMNELNRRCVAQSRSKCALYFIGNSITFAKSSKWSQLLSTMKNNKNLSSALTLVCPSHKDSRIHARKASDIPQGPFCRLPCSLKIDCNKHLCQKPCMPKHGHDMCMVQEPFIFPRCKHRGTKACYMPKEQVGCKKQCQKKMHCGVHDCERTCDPEHNHSYCFVTVTSALKCGHTVDHHCSESISEKQCEAEVKVKHPKCGHLVKKKCFQDVTLIICKRPCENYLEGCGHQCQNTCGQTCTTSVSCIYCIRIEEERELMKQKRKAQEKRRHIETLQMHLDTLKTSFPSTCYAEIHSSGNDAEEYNTVADRLKKYIVLEHKWRPEITKIEKVHSYEREMMWVECHRNVQEPMKSRLLFHGTSAEAIDPIIEDGFKLPSKRGMYGKGIYFATDSSKSALYSRRSNKLLLCEVLIGRCKTVESAQKTMDGTTLSSLGYDSIYAKRDTKQTGGVYNDEYVIFNPDQAIVRYIIHYQCK